jgi:hypothetical protein
MTADILRREGLEPVKYASSDRLIINYEKEWFERKVQSILDVKHVFPFFPTFFTKYFLC